MLGFPVSAASTPRATVAGTSGFYYLTFGPQDRARALVQGTGEQAVLNKAGAYLPEVGKRSKVVKAR